MLRYIDEKDIDPTEMRMIAKGESGLVSLIPGDSDAGLGHLLDRHFDGTEINTDADETTFFPSGGTPTSRGTGPSAELPTGMNRDDIAPSLRRAIEDGSEDGGTYIATFRSSRYGIKKVQVNTNSGTVATAYPLEGPNVRRWNRNTDQREKWTSSGWTRWTKPYQGSNTSPSLMTPITIGAIGLNKA